MEKYIVMSPQGRQELTSIVETFRINKMNNLGFVALDLDVYVPRWETMYVEYEVRTKPYDCQTRYGKRVEATKYHFFNSSPAITMAEKKDDLYQFLEKEKLRSPLYMGPTLYHFLKDNNKICGTYQVELDPDMSRDEIIDSNAKLLLIEGIEI